MKIFLVVSLILYLIEFGHQTLRCEPHWFPLTVVIGMIGWTLLLLIRSFIS